MNGRLSSETVGEIVASDFRKASVFEQYGIDFCCGGKRTFNEACRSAAVDPVDVQSALDALGPSLDVDTDPTDQRLDRLIDRITSTHHAYVRTAVPTIRAYLAKLIDVHGGRHPELRHVAACFDVLSTDLAQHLLKEEQVLFPYVRELSTAAAGERHCPSPFGTVENPIRMMEREHQEAGDQMRVIRELTHGYTAPDDGCTTYAVCMAELQRFERDLHRHVHLENNVLFPAAIALENGSPAD